MSRDEKLLNTFKKINEMNVNKMAENPDFVFPSVSSMAQLANMRNQSIGNFLASGYVLSKNFVIKLNFLNDYKPD